jgi:hypothetical protein
MEMLVGAAAGNITKIDELALSAANVVRVSFVDIDGRLWSSMTCLKD